MISRGLAAAGHGTLPEGALGLIRGEPTHVRVLFHPKVARYVQRRQWHPTQRFRHVDGGIEMAMDVRGHAGTGELDPRLRE